ncbi:MAG: hypothetical protein RL386_1675, partial [Bacteroidota bacterium]
VSVHTAAQSAKNAVKAINDTA